MKENLRKTLFGEKQSKHDIQVTLMTSDISFFSNHSLTVMIKPLRLAYGYGHSRMTEVYHPTGK